MEKPRITKEGVSAVMGGRVLEYEAKTIKREGIEEGKAAERENSIRNTV